MKTLNFQNHHWKCWFFAAFVAHFHVPSQSNVGFRQHTAVTTSRRTLNNQQLMHVEVYMISRLPCCLMSTKLILLDSHGHLIVHFFWFITSIDHFDSIFCSQQIVVCLRTQFFSFHFNLRLLSHVSSAQLKMFNLYLFLYLIHKFTIFILVILLLLALLYLQFIAYELRSGLFRPCVHRTRAQVF